jgi:hypothetical protein
VKLAREFQACVTLAAVTLAAVTLAAVTLASVTLAALLGSPAGAQQPGGPQFSFCVLGHLRGDKDGQQLAYLDELIDEVRRLEPDLVFLTGDLIWGGVGDPAPNDPAVVRSDWEALDAALKRIPAPVYRVPGNHDVNDLVTRDVWNERYGLLPRAIDHLGCRFLLFASGWVPEDGDLRKHPPEFARGRNLDRAERAFLGAELDLAEDYEHVFLFMHHMLWWEEGASWWREVHPLLVGRKVRAVFAGDYGPMKFSHLDRHNVHYLQTSVESEVTLGELRGSDLARQRSAQVDNFLHVVVDGPEVRYEVHTVGALSSDKFSPQRWRAINEYDKDSIPRRLWTQWNDPGRLFKGVLKVSGVSFLAGAVLVLSLILLRRFLRGGSW